MQGWIIDKVLVMTELIGLEFGVSEGGCMGNGIGRWN